MEVQTLENTLIHLNFYYQRAGKNNSIRISSVFELAVGDTDMGTGRYWFSEECCKKAEQSVLDYATSSAWQEILRSIHYLAAYLYICDKTMPDLSVLLRKKLRTTLNFMKLLNSSNLLSKR